ncbi:methyltransferase domain-containing protein [Nisaea sediminum]|uniref:hypothetical protein n=1 Tax=Nisaea sediminum TaxID=2775867 RepID=UPI0018686C18|nr:hypothetical protein [Nisaea sediminum]
MGLNVWEIGQIAWLIENLKKRSQGGTFRTLSLGYPDLLISRPQLVALIGEEATSRVSLRENAEHIARAHKQHHLQGYVPDAKDLFAEFGSDFLAIDIQQFPTTDMVVDLNEPLPESLVGQFDLVIDPGTTEHCFNVAQCMKNSSSALKVGGGIFHLVPGSYINHGFYSFSPTFFLDYYERNGFLTLKIVQVSFDDDWNATEHDRMTFDVLDDLPAGPVLLDVIALKVEEKEITWPRQRMYGGP